MKLFASIVIAICIFSHSSNCQDHPFKYLHETESQAEFISGFANAIEYVVNSPNLKLEEIRRMISTNTFLSEKEKKAMLIFVDSRDRGIKNKRPFSEYCDESIEALDDSLSMLHAYIAIRKTTSMALNNTEGYSSAVEKLVNYQSENYPSWLHGYLYFTLSINALQQKDYEQFISYADTASHMLETNNHFAMQGQLYHTVGDELFFRRVDTASVFLEKALEIEQQHGLEYLRMRTLTDLAGLDRYVENYEACVAKQYQVIGLAEELKDTSFIIEGKMRLSVTMSAQGGKQLDEAIKVLKEAQVLALEIGDNGRYARTFDYLGGVYLNKEEYREAISNFERRIKLSDESEVDKLIITYLELAVCYNELGNTDSTYIAVVKSNEYNGGRNIGYQQYGELILTDYYIENKQLDKAKAGAELGLQMAGDYDKGMKSVSLNQLRKIYEAKGDYKKAYQYFVEFDEVEHLLENEDLSLKISEARIEANYEAEKKVLLANSEKEQAIVEARQKQYMYLAGIAALISAFLSGLYFLLRSKNKQINRKNAELEKLNNVKDQLFQIIGHDLRKPALAFRNVSKNLNYLIDKGDAERIKRLGIEIDQEGKNLYNLTDNLLHWALMQKDLLSIKPTKINVHNAVADNIEIFQSTAKYKGVKLINEIDEEMNILADRNSMDTIIRNLIDNALKYSTEDGEIKLEASHNGSLIDIAISDKGIGMTPQEVNQILNDDQTESKEGTANEKGSGLGMKIVMSMIFKNEGSININSSKGEGSIFVVSLPKAS